MKRNDWIGGNRLKLLENGEEYFPAVFAAIEAAQREVLIETFILFEDKIGLALHAVLLAAAQRGVKVHLTVDGFGSPMLSSKFIDELTAAGGQLHVFDPPPRLSRRLQPFRRLHRKIVVVDGELGFIGGINFSADHLGDYGPEAKQDYAVEVRGPIVEKLRRESRLLIERPAAPKAGPPEAGRADAQVVIRDNGRHRDDIEREYRRALQLAQREVIIANAYFFPGYRLMRSLQKAARRGVQVHLILQGQKADIAWATFAARMVYDRLIEAGVHVHEYCKRPMHGKVALVDEDWSTIGSSNLDPLSLSLNLEANLVVRDRDFNAQLRRKLLPLLREQCQKVSSEQTHARRWWWRLGIGYLVFHAMRHFPRWAARLPEHQPRIVPAAESTVVVAKPQTEAAEPWAWQHAAEPAPEAACQ